ncbi:hypothetical protein [Paraburkholderia sp. J8-2]|uniref:hypothetical protein n=1 Tax=Paraburkholderia sp. J8-2 TaxID=2805440 RepID=UPI002AB6985B|nr:hypothetical protein [Paraburkholderia sp. J8-2]
MSNAIDTARADIAAAVAALVGNDTFKRYIETELAGDFAEVVARIVKAAATRAPTAAHGLDADTRLKTNDALCSFAGRWSVDGDYLRCVKCRRPHIASKADMDFDHAAGCKLASTSEVRPWRALLAILAPLYAAPAATDKPAQGVRLMLTDDQRAAIEWAAGRAQVAALGKPVDGIEGQRWRVLSDLSRTAAAQPDERAAVEWPALPAFPSPTIKHANGSGYFTEHQMQGYANAYGAAVRASASQATAAQPSERIDENAAFEARFPMPAQCQRAGEGYAATGYNAWDAHGQIERWVGWRARAELGAAPLQLTGLQVSALRVAAETLIERYAAPLRALLANAEHAEGERA